MENILKKRLAIIKARARRLRENSRKKLRTGEAANDEPHGTGEGLRWSSRTTSSTGLDPAGLGGGDCRLEEAAPGEERSISSYRCYFIRTSAGLLDSTAHIEAELLSEIIASPLLIRRLFRPSREKALPRGLRADRVCFLDIETTGLSPSTYIFLCGLMVLGGEGFSIEQIFARDYSEEGALLFFLSKTLKRFHVVITYNGSSFDIPFIRTRMAVNKLNFREDFLSLDLLEPTRRAFSRKLPNCKLETVERYLGCARWEGDIAGRDIPEVYHEFVRTGDASSIRNVLYHNQMDLLSMAVLLNRLVFDPA